MNANWVLSCMRKEGFEARFDLLLFRRFHVFQTIYCIYIYNRFCFFDASSSS